MTHFTIPYMRYLTEVGVLEKGSVLPAFAQDSAQLQSSPDWCRRG